MATDDEGNSEPAPLVASARCGVDLSSPPTPTPLSPLDEELLSTTLPQFIWTEENDLSGITYELSIDDNPDFSSPLLKTGLKTASYILQENERLGEDVYFWRVRTIDGSGHVSEWSDAKRFFVIDLTPTATISVGYVPAGGMIDLDLTPYLFFITKAQIVVNTNLSDVTANITEYTAEEFGQKFEWISPAPGIPYAYYSMVSPKVDKTTVNFTRVEFRISKSWLKTNEVDENTIRLLRLVGGRWENITPTKIGEDEENLYFKATIAGFSSILSASGEKMKKPEITMLIPWPPMLIFAILAIFAALGGGLGYFVHIRRTRPIPPSIPLHRIAPTPAAIPAPKITPAVPLKRLPPAPVTLAGAPPTPAKPVAVPAIPVKPAVAPTAVLEKLGSLAPKVPELPPAAPRIPAVPPAVALAQLAKVARPVTPAAPPEELAKIMMRAPAIKIEKLEKVAKPVEPAVVLEKLKTITTGGEKMPAAQPSALSEKETGGILEKLLKKRNNRRSNKS
ncbi:MAG: PGF-pre-PGF domain-containing protein [Candidatus Hadarchaeales archaeon]